MNLKEWIEKKFDEKEFTSLWQVAKFLGISYACIYEHYKVGRDLCKKTAMRIEEKTNGEVSRYEIIFPELSQKKEVLNGNQKSS